MLYLRVFNAVQYLHIFSIFSCIFAGLCLRLMQFWRRDNCADCGMLSLTIVNHFLSLFFSVFLVFKHWTLCPVLHHGSYWSTDKEQQNLLDQLNVDLTYAVCLNLAIQHQANDNDSWEKMLQAFPIVSSTFLWQFTLLKTNMETPRLFDAVCRCVSFSNWPFWGSMLVFGEVLLYRPQSRRINMFLLHELAKLQDNEALTIYTQIVKNKQYPFSGRFRVNMGNIYFKQEKWTAAIKMYRMALDQIPNNVQAT